MPVSHAYVTVPVLTMRESTEQNESCPTTKVVSQALYGEKVHLVDEKGSWAKIITPDDQYAGWVPKAGLLAATKDSFKPGNRRIRTNRLASHVYHTSDTEYGPILTLPFGRPLKLLEEMSGGRWLKIELIDEKEAYIQRGDVSFSFHPIHPSHLFDFAFQFKGLPYTWGGRSSFGYDCSGFIQMLFKEMGYLIARDAKDQYRSIDFQPVSMNELQPGDLLFFGPQKKQDEAQRITHVVMYYKDNMFIHSGTKRPGPYICLSHLMDEEWRENSSSLPFREARRHRCFTGEVAHL